jgi:hypothetical protein
MGLIERQARHLLETETIPSYESDIREMAPGAATKLEIDWDSLGDDKDAYAALANSPRSAIYNIAIGSTIWTLDEICRNPIGKSAVAEGLKAIRIVHKRSGERGIASFDKGVLTLTVDCTVEGQPEPADVKSLLENGL